MKNLRWFAVAFALALVAGCGSKKVDKVAIPDTPDGAVKAVAQSIADDKPQAVWSAMPEQYQKDVNALLTEFGNKMDAETYDRTFVVLGKSVDVLDKQRTFIFGHPLVASTGQKAVLEKNWDKIVALVRDLVNSDIKTVKGVQNLDVEAFLGTTGSKLSKNIKELAAVAGQNEMAENIKKLKDTKVVVKESKGDKATLEITGPTGKTETEEYTKVGGKWVPSKMAADWDKTIAEAKTKLASFEVKPEDKAKAIEQLDKADKSLDKLLAAKSQEEFNVAAGEVLGPIMGLMMGGGGFGGGGPPGFGPGGPAGPDFGPPGGGAEFPGGVAPPGFPSETK